jgi:4-amino-4-deoxy-L-arabinose transferase-like glycosyltransferase|tara:strand:- start:1997 stop:2185 length:189 start_codon:yes stop_codon:yes gene_type:complete
MFSTGQLIFVIFFVIAFVILMLLAYRKDAGLHKKQYKGSKWVLVGFLAFIGLLFLIKFVLKR